MASRMKMENGEEASVPTLEQETREQQRRAIFALIPAAVIALAGFAAIGYGKYWNDIPLAGGVLWGAAYGGLLALALYPRRIYRIRGGFTLGPGRLRLIAISWAFLLGALMAVAVHFALMTDDLSGRVTFAVMIVGLSGAVLAVTYMMPLVAMAFFAPLFVSLFVSSLQIDPHISWVQKLFMIVVFGVLFYLLIRFNWRLWQSGVRAAVEREAHRFEILERQAEMDAARRIQMGLLPSAGQALREEARYDLAALLEPARDMTGDLYDFFPVDRNRLFFMVGDVCGKGVASSLLMAITKTVIKNAVLREDTPLGQVMTDVNAELSRENHDHQFVTCLAGILDLDTGRVEFCNAGHEPMLLLRSGGAIETSETVGGPPLCAFEGIEYETGQFDLSRGDGFLMVSDGVTEAPGRDGQLFGVEGLKTLAASFPGDVRPSALIAGIGDALSSDPDIAVDDRTILVLRYHGAG